MSKQLWDKQPGESPQAYQAFLKYRDLGPLRSLIGAYRLSDEKADAKSPSSRWKLWASKHTWATRADAYDAHISDIERTAREKEVAERAAVMERRRAKAQDSAWELYEKLLAKTQQMLMLPVINVTQKEGAKIIRPIRWDYASLARVLDVMTRLIRVGTGQDSGMAALVNINWETMKEKLSEEQLERIAAGEDLLRVIFSQGSLRAGDGAACTAPS